MARERPVFACQDCGTAYGKWSGRCDACGAWNSIEQQKSRKARIDPGRAAKLVALDAETTPLSRLKTGISELDRVLGGGLVAGSVLLIGGDPGIGKSTITLQLAAQLSQMGLSSVYISGEESLDQIRLRARRLGVEKAPVQLAASTSAEEVLAAVADEPPTLLIIDSIQTLFTEQLDQAPGTVTQLRAATQMMVDLAKTRSTVVLLIGHVTKDGQIAGPKLLEHMVDTVLYFEGERGHSFRILRAVKNRFGPANEIGVFEMAEKGLIEVSNPSALFLSSGDRTSAGTAVFAGIEGTRPLLVEIQALVGNQAPGSPRRAVVGWDSNRLAMLLAVLESRLGLHAAGRDVYLNVAGGLKVLEPAADLAVAAALLSSLIDKPVPAGTVIFGEIGLSGEVRPVGQQDVRLKEAEKLGFERVIMPKNKRPVETTLECAAIGHLKELLRLTGSTKN